MCSLEGNVCSVSIETAHHAGENQVTMCEKKTFTLNFTNEFEFPELIQDLNIEVVHQKTFTAPGLGTLWEPGAAQEPKLVPAVKMQI